MKEIKDTNRITYQEVEYIYNMSARTSQEYLTKARIYNNIPPRGMITKEEFEKYLKNRHENREPNN